MSYILMFISVALLTPTNHHQEFLSHQDCLVALVTIEEATTSHYRAQGIKPPVLVCVPKGEKE